MVMALKTKLRGGLSLNLNIKLGPNGIIPTYATDGAACFDIYSAEYCCWEAGMTVTISTDLYVEVPSGYEMQIRSRSGSSIRGVVVANAPGTIDSDYRGEVKIILHNQSMWPVQVRKGERIAQGCISPVQRVSFTEVEELNCTQRGAGGFGSTGS
jgi:dUTP pyrophosphatase